MTEGPKDWAAAGIGLGAGVLGAMAYMMGGLGRPKEPTVKELKSEKEHLERSHVIANRALTNSAVVLSTIMDAAAEGANELRKERLVIDTLKEEKASLEIERDKLKTRTDEFQKVVSERDLLKERVRQLESLGASKFEQSLRAEETQLAESSESNRSAALYTALIRFLPDARNYVVLVLSNAARRAGISEQEISRAVIGAVGNTAGKHGPTGPVGSGG
jgi:hypothetical protein